MSAMATGTPDDTGEQSLARDMAEVHGAEAAAVARDNARVAALTGQEPQAKSWIRVLGIIQRRRINQEIRSAGPDNRPLSLPTANPTQG